MNLGFPARVFTPKICLDKLFEIFQNSYMAPIVPTESAFCSKRENGHTLLLDLCGK